MLIVIILPINPLHACPHKETSQKSKYIITDRLQILFLFLS